MADIGSEIGVLFENVWAAVKVEAQKVEGEVLSVGQQLVSSAVADIEQVFTVGLPLAIQAVITEAPKVISGQEKFGNAVTNVMQALEAKLGPVAVQDVQALIQLAFRGAQKIASGNVPPAAA